MTMFVDSGLSDEMAEKIVAFVDREAGRDAPLTADDEAAVRQMITDDPAVRALVEELRATNAGLDTLLDDVAAVEVPDRLVAMIQGHGANAIAAPAFGERRSETEDEAGDDGDVVALAQPAMPRRSYGPLAAAASIALLISSGALFHVYNTSTTERTQLQAVVASTTEEAETRGRALADARAELNRLAGLAEQASTQRRETADQLMANEEAVQRLEVERAAIEGRYAALEGENERLNELLETQRAEIAESEAARDRISTDLADARQALTDAEATAADTQATLTAEVENLANRLDQRAQEVASLADELEAGEQRSETASAVLARIREEQASLERRLAAAELDKQQLQAERQAAEDATSEAEQRLATLQADIQDAESRLATVVAGLTASEAGRREAVQAVFGLEAELAASKSWLGQIAQYHRVYASTARRHLVEVGADELDHIQEWLTKMLGRQILVPDLTDFGVTFAGARLLGINEKPVAQLVYLDADDQPLALCIIPSTGDAKDPTLSTNGELNLVDWRDGQHGYAVVGWSDPSLLATLTEAIQPVYDL
ncbi:MAG: hypothetical protein ACR2RA_03960 [Geminicoccaceae bacterium]